MSEANNVRVQKMDSNELGRYVAAQTVGVLRRLEELRPLYTELWERFDNLKQNEKILGCRTKTEYCQKILHRSIRSVQYALNGRTKRSELDRPFEKLRPVDVEDVEDFVPDDIAEADRKRETAEARKQFEERCRREEAERRTWEKAHPEEAEKQKQEAEQRRKELEERRERWKKEQQDSEAQEKFTQRFLRQLLGGEGRPPADAVREFATLGRREAARKYHNNGQYPERMAEMNRVADWLEALAGGA